MDAYPRSSDWLDSSEHESFFTKLKYVDCLTQYESSNLQYKKWSNIRVYNFYDTLFYFKELKYISFIVPSFNLRN